MDLKCIDRLQESKELVKGLCDIMFYMESSEQDAMVPITIFIPFRTVLEEVLALLEEAEETEKEKRYSDQKQG